MRFGQSKFIDTYLTSGDYISRQKPTNPDFWLVVAVAFVDNFLLRIAYHELDDVAGLAYFVGWQQLDIAAIEW